MMGPLKSLFGGDEAKVTAPPSTPMADEEDPSVLAARKRRYEMASSRSGRASTILSDSYGNDKLGGRA